MAYSPVGFINPQYYVDYANWWLKGYQQATTTPLSMATDGSGLTQIVRAEITSAGFIKTSGGALFTPHFNQAYDIWIFPTAAEADANDTTNAVQVADNLWLDDSVDAIVGDVVKSFDVVSSMVASTDLSIGDIVSTGGYLGIGDGGSNLYEVVATGTGTADGGSFIDLAAHQAKGLFSGGEILIEQFGASPSSSGSVNHAAITNALVYARSVNSGADCARGGVFSVDSTINLLAGQKLRSKYADYIGGFQIKPTSAVSVGVSVSEADGTGLENVMIDMTDMSISATYTASTISFDSVTNTINDSANGLGVFSIGDVVGVTGSASNNEHFMVANVTAGTLSVVGVGTTEAAGASVTITAGANGIRIKGGRRGQYKSVYVFGGASSEGTVGWNLHDGLRSTFYNVFLDCTTKPDVGVKLGVGFALFTTDESVLTAFTTNTFLSCQAQAWDYGWLTGNTGSGLEMFSCNGESSGTLGIYTKDTLSANNTAVKVHGGEWHSADAGKAGSLHLMGCTVNGPVGSNVLDEQFGKFLNQPVQLNRIVADDDEFTTSATNLPLQINPNGSGGMLVRTAGSAFARTNAVHGGGLEVYRATSSATADVFEIYSDVGGAGSQIFLVEGDGDTFNATGSYGTISDQRLKQQVKAASSQWNDIKSLNIVNYKLNRLVEQSGDDAPFMLGVMAQELEAAGMGGLVRTKPLTKLVDKVDDNGDKYQEEVETGEDVKAVKYSILYMKAVKALQEAMERIEALEAKVG